MHSLRDTDEGRAWLLVNGICREEYIAKREKHDNQQPSKSSSGPFIAWDGEGVTVRRKHRYILLANSYGNYLHEAKGIATMDALHFLCDEAKRDRRANHVMYGASYDVNMILGNLASHQVTELAWTGRLHYGPFRLEYRPRKELMVTRYEGRHKTENKDITIQLWDVIGFFQCRFVQALENWLRDLDEETLAYIEDMKRKRSGFASEDFDAVLRYCLKECDLLVQLMTRMRNKMRPVKLIPTRWDGAGAIGQRLLQNNKIPTYFGDAPDEAKRASQYAYFGGRIECVRYGNREERVFSHDIRSAYPSAMRSLPCLAHGRWTHSRRGLGRTDGAFQLCRIKWSFRSVNAIHPLPWRERSGAVFFPARGEGWYWRPEAELVRDFRPNEYEVMETWTFHPECEHQPFHFVDDVYEQRDRMRRAGHDAHIVLKLALNSLYGKLAQKIGWDQKKNLPPRYHNLMYAGMITATTRAKLYRLAMQHPKDVIAFETDGLYSTVRHECDEGTALGQWEVESHDGITYLQSGLYWLLDDGVWWSKSRGLSRDIPTGEKGKGLTRDHVLLAWSMGSWEVEVTETRFRTMASAVVSPERFTEWRQWCDDTKTLTTIPRGKRVVLPKDLEQGTWALRGLHATLAAGGGGLSTPHHLPWVDGLTVMETVQDSYRIERDLDDEYLETDITA